MTGTGDRSLDSVEVPILFERESGSFEIGIPASEIVPQLNRDLEKYRGIVQEKDLQRLEVKQVRLNFIEGGMKVSTLVTSQFRSAIEIGDREHFTPWISLDADFYLELSAQIQNQVLYADVRDFRLSAPAGQWYRPLLELGGALLKEEMVAYLREQLQVLNGTHVEQWFEQYGRERLKEELKITGWSARKIERILASLELNCRISPQYLWISAKYPPSLDSLEDEEFSLWDCCKALIGNLLGLSARV